MSQVQADHPARRSPRATLRRIAARPGVGEVPRVDVVGQHRRVARRGGRPADRAGSRAAPARAGRTRRGRRSPRRSGPGSARSRPGPRPRRGPRGSGATTCGCPARGPRSVTSRAASGYCCSHVPTARTVTAAPRSCSRVSTRRGEASSPAPWKVSATSGRPVPACASSPVGAGGRRTGTPPVPPHPRALHPLPSRARLRRESQGAGPHRPPLPTVRGRRRAGRPEPPGRHALVAATLASHEPLPLPVVRRIGAEEHEASELSVAPAGPERVCCVRAAGDPAVRAVTSLDSIVSGAYVGASVTGVPDPGEHRRHVTGCRAGFPHGEGPPMCTGNGRPDRPSPPSSRPVGPSIALRDVDGARIDGPSRPGHRSHG